MSDTLVLGQWNVICDRCGVKRKSGQVTQTWDKLIVCKPEVSPGCFEHRHPQDFMRPVKDDMSVPFTRSEPADQFVTADYIDASVGTQERDKPAGTFNTTDTIGE